ncbi:MAG: hypothetical protein HFJ49_01400 [Clostridia bacterium]|nr:hypothetical protein [Clostridia bacterium]
MKVKVIIANNDIMYMHLSKIASKTKEKIEIINVPNDKLYSLICQIKPKQKLIILDPTNSVNLSINLLKNAIGRIDKDNIIILVIDFSNISNIINYNKKHYHFLNNGNVNGSLFNILTLISDSLEDFIELEKIVDSILYRLNFTMHFKGVKYLKDAILLAYKEKSLLYDTQSLIKEVATKNHIDNDKIVRSNIDRALINMLNYANIDKLYEVFSNYDGRTISLKYFIDLCIYYLDKKKNYIFES